MRVTAGDMHMSRSSWLFGLGAGIVMLGGPPCAATAVPPAASGATLQAQVKDADAKVAAARAHHTALQAQVRQLEQHNATQQTQLRQRDAEIAALQQKLQAAGVPAASTSTSAGH